jgi:hypothetical protein
MSPNHPDLPRPSAGRGKIAGLVGLGVVALLGWSTGLRGVLVGTGLYLLFTGIWAVVRRGSWLGKTTRRVGAAIVAGGLVLVIAGTAAAAPVRDKVSGASSRTSSRSRPAPAVRPVPTPAVTSLQGQANDLAAPERASDVDAGPIASAAAPRTALATVLLLDVKGRAAKTGYDRTLFGSGWVDVDRNGCDTRNDMLARDLVVQTFKAGTNDCVVLTGTLADPYGPSSITFTRGAETSSAVQIDHVVALSDAWQKGAQAWAGARRVAFANDPMNLLAVDGPLNMQKGDGDTATWLPPNKAYRCRYVARQVGVKYTYGLWVTGAERAAMVSVLSSCPTEPLPSGSTVPPAPAPAVVAPAPAPEIAVAPAPAPAPAPVPVPAPALAPATSVYYPNCAAARAAGAAPVRTGDPGYSTKLDRDRDGVGCE